MPLLPLRLTAGGVFFVKCGCPLITLLIDGPGHLILRVAKLTVHDPSPYSMETSESSVFARRVSGAVTLIIPTSFAGLRPGVNVITCLK